MDVQFFTWARYAEIHPDGSLTLVGAGKDLHQIDALPLAFPLFYLISRVVLEKAEASEPHTMQYSIVSPEGDVFIQSEEFAVKDPGGIKDFREFLHIHTMLVLANVAFANEGYYRFELKFDGQVVKKAHMRVEVQKPAGDLVISGASQK